MRTLLSSLLTLTLLSGCDIIDMPKSGQSGPVNPGSGVTRRVLLEDCTGPRCPNCPEAAEIAESIKDFYNTTEDRVIVVDINMVDQFSAPEPPNYTTDFRTPAGYEYEQTFGIAALGLPRGLVDRKPYNGSMGIARTSWSSAVAQVIDLPADMDLWFDSFNFNSTTNVVTATVKVLTSSSEVPPAFVARAVMV